MNSEDKEMICWIVLIGSLFLWGMAATIIRIIEVVNK